MARTAPLIHFRFNFCPGGTIISQLKQSVQSTSAHRVILTQIYITRHDANIYHSVDKPKEKTLAAKEQKNNLKKRWQKVRRLSLRGPQSRENSRSLCAGLQKTSTFDLLVWLCRRRGVMGGSGPDLAAPGPSSLATTIISSYCVQMCCRCDGAINQLLHVIWPLLKPRVDR